MWRTVVKSVKSSVGKKELQKADLRAKHSDFRMAGETVVLKVDEKVEKLVC